MKYITIIPFIIYLSLISGCTSHSNQKVEDNKESKFKDTSEMVKEKLIKDTAIIQSDAINIISTKVSNKTYDKDSIDKKQYNIAYKGKNNVMKVMDIFKNIHYLPLETKESSLLDFNIISTLKMSSHQDQKSTCLTKKVNLLEMLVKREKDQKNISLVL